MKFIPNSEFENVANEPYRRVWTKPISTYASNYNLFGKLKNTFIIISPF